MRTKITIIILMLVLGGCNLAQPYPSESTNQNEPTLVGVYVVMNKDYNDIPDFDINNKELTYFLFEEKVKDGQKYNYSIASGNFYQSHMHVNVSDTEEKLKFTSTLPRFSNEDGFYHVLAIHKLSDGSYEQTSLNTYLYDGDGAFMFEESYSTTTENITKTKTISFDIQVKRYDPLISLKLIYLDDSYSIIDTLAWNGENFFVIDQDVSYIMIEELRLNVNDEMIKTLTVIDRNIITDEVPYKQTIVTSNDRLLSPIMVLQLVNKVPVE